MNNITNIAFNPDGSITVNYADTTTPAATYVNNTTLPQPFIPVTEVDVVQGANTIKFVPSN